jgi:protein gp37
MAEGTKIEWADHTFNPWIGCTKVGPGCDHCYAEADFDKRRHVVTWGAGQPRKLTADSTWALPRRWDKKAQIQGVRYRVFCASLADVFDNEVPVQWRISLVKLILRTPHLDWLLLTKRIGNAADMLETAFRAVHSGREGWADNVPPNVWIGATITSQAEADRDIPKLLRVPAAKRFLSMEPLLGPVELLEWLRSDCWQGSRPGPSGRGGVTCMDCNGYGHQCRSLHWVIVGGESGPGARPMHPDWARSLRDQCKAAGVPFLFKQWGEWMPEAAMTHDLRMRDCGQFECLFTKLDGSTHWIDPDDHTPYDASDVRMVKVGKKAADRLLDGRTWDEVPS